MKRKLKGKVTQLGQKKLDKKGLEESKNEQQVEMTDGKRRLLEAYEIYNRLTNGKISDFEKVKNYIAEKLEQLLQEGKIGKGVILVSRIKAPESAVQNWKLGKGLYDIFGITLLTTNQQEMDEIRARLRKDKQFHITSKKQMNEKRGYEAIHFLFNVGEDDGNNTKVECHMQTHEKYKNVYPHVLYKVRRKLHRELTPEEEIQIKGNIQEMYDNKEVYGDRLLNGRSCRIPQMWVTSFNQQGKMEEQELDEDMILTIMYPFLDISKKNSKQKHISQEEEQEEIEI